jgi:hypothetical protein
LTIISIFLI